MDGEDSEKDAPRRIKGEHQNVSVAEQLKVFVCKSGKRGKSAAKPDGEKQPRVRA